MSARISSHSARDYDYYRSVIERNGGTMTPDGPTVLGVRGEDIRGRVHDTTSSKIYDDTIVVLGADHGVRLFPAVTHPAQKYSSTSPGGAVGEIEPGAFIAEPHGPHNGLPSWQVLHPNGSDGLPGWRDYNHDGVIEDEEKRRSEQQGDTLHKVLVHGSRRRDEPTSIGCQVMSPANQRRFINVVGGEDTHFNYLLLDVHDVPGGIQIPAPARRSHHHHHGRRHCR